MRLAAFLLLFPTALLAATAGADLSGIRNNGIEYVSLEDGAAFLGLRLERLVPTSTVMLKDGAKPEAKLVEHSRETDVLGLRVFLGDPVIERGGKFYMSRADFLDHVVPRLRPDLCGPAPRPPHVIVLDAGHGGVDHGTENPGLHSMEKTYTLDVALRLRRLLEAAGYKVMMIREADVTIPKENRAAIADQWSPDLYVSIHFNSLYPNTRTTGVEVMAFPARNQRSTDSWSPGKRDDSESGDAPINKFAAWNTVLGSILHRHLLETLHSGDRGEKFEHLAVLRGLICPGVLVEPAFLSSDSEGGRLATPAFRDTIAGAIFDGIQDYSDELRRLEPRQVTVPPATNGQAPPPAPSAAPAAAPAPRALPTRPAADS
jgi:N-acetylmuramoyl-L-alanine amidase